MFLWVSSSAGEQNRKQNWSLHYFRLFSGLETLNKLSGQFQRFLQVREIQLRNVLCYSASLPSYTLWSSGEDGVILHFIQFLKKSQKV